MPTPNRGYVYPTTSSPATVPADLRVPLEQVDADVQTLVDEAAAKVGLNPDGTAPPALEAQVRALISTEAPPPDLSAYSTTTEVGEMVDDKIEAALAETDGMIPIFPTLAEAQVWEVANPGRVALTIEDQSPDTVPPTPGAMSISPEGTFANAVVAGADDDRGTVFYSFRLGSGAWSEWQTEPRYKFSGLTVLTSYTASHRVQDIGSNVVVGAQVPFETLEADTWGTLWSDSMASHPDGSLTGEAWSNAPGTVVWQEGLRHYSQDDGLPPTEGVSVVGGVAVRSGAGDLSGPGSFVELPSVPTRVLISITSIANSARYVPFPVVGGADDVNWTAVDANGQPADYKTIAHSLWRGSYGAHSIKAQETASFTGTATDGWRLHTFSWDINTSTRVVDFRQDSELKLTYTIPESVWTGGTRYGFWMGKFPEGGWVTDFSIRWE